MNPIPNNQSEASPRTSFKNILLWILALLLALALGAAGYFFYLFQGSKEEIKKASETKEEIKSETEVLMAEIGALMLLPEGEMPTVAAVNDKEKLAGQVFFAQAENGDKVLIYEKSGRAILYRPSVKKIINVATTSGGTQSVNSSETTPEETKSAIGGDDEIKKNLTIGIYNGGAPKGTAAILFEELKKDGYATIKTGNTEKNYTGVTIYYGSETEKTAEAVRASIIDTYPETVIKAVDASDSETSLAPITIILGK